MLLAGMYMCILLRITTRFRTTAVCSVFSPFLFSSDFHLKVWVETDLDDSVGEILEKPVRVPRTLALG